MDERPTISNAESERCGQGRPRGPDTSGSREQQPTHLDLFSGIGGFALAAQWSGFRTIGFCEIDKYCRKVLAKNFMADAEQSAGWFQHRRGESCTLENQRNDVPRVYADILDLDGRDFYGVSLITGGFPCQPFSVAGKRRGAADDRALWPEMFRIIKEARPAWMLGENVPGIIGMELDNVLSNLESIGYATRPFVIPACAVDARHRRDRVWIIAGNVSDPERDGPSCAAQRRSFVEAAGEKSAWAHHALYAAGTSGAAATEGNVSHAIEQRGRSGNPEREHAGYVGERSEDQGNDRNGVAIWLSEPGMGRVAHGIPSRVDRLKGLGNAIVPPLAYEILREIRKLI